MKNTTKKQYALFCSGNIKAALDAGCIKEILEKIEVSEILFAPVSVKGITGYNGAIIPVFDLSGSYSRFPGRESSGSITAVITTTKGTAAILFDSFNGMGTGDDIKNTQSSPFLQEVIINDLNYSFVDPEMLVSTGFFK
ncbi:MAG: chemotaxis protein CheW [Candidatus Goldbacteria bacterium]|nr:chemotaxis protein CheW [Candidatus Goldiibacteriota bacterium]